MRRIVKHIPNFITSLNLVSGFVAITYACRGDLMGAFFFVLLAALFDFLDGGFARVLKAQSEVGKQLDSLSDVVSFGVAPGFVLYMMMGGALGIENPLDISKQPVTEILFLGAMILVPVFSAIRLAKFNIDTRQTDSFLGMPVPANAIFIVSLGALSSTSTSTWLLDSLLNPYVLVFVAVVQSYLLVSSLPMFSLKLKTLSWRDNYLQYVFLLASTILVITLGVLGIAATIILYLLLSIIVRFLGK